jgi:hypothetical protein
MERKNYPDDLSEEERSRIEVLLKPEKSKGGRKPNYGKREQLNAIFYSL